MKNYKKLISLLTVIFLLLSLTSCFLTPEDKLFEESLVSESSDLEPVYKDIGSSFDGLRVVKSKDNLYGYIDDVGKVIIKPIFQYAENFKNGHAIVVLEKTKNDFEKSEDFDKLNYKVSLINLNGDIILEEFSYYGNSMSNISIGYENEILPVYNSQTSQNPDGVLNIKGENAIINKDIKEIKNYEIPYLGQSNNSDYYFFDIYSDKDDVWFLDYDRRAYKQGDDTVYYWALISEGRYTSSSYTLFLQDVEGNNRFLPTYLN